MFVVSFIAIPVFLGDRFWMRRSSHVPSACFIVWADFNILTVTHEDSFENGEFEKERVGRTIQLLSDNVWS
jgi:hypothetical protein